MTGLAVVLPAFNAASVIERALASLVEQELVPNEVIVVDDASTDATAEVAEGWKDRLPIRLVRNPMNLGIGGALHNGVAAASHDLVLRIDADDRWLPHHARRLHELADNHPAAVLFASRATTIDPQGRRMGVSRGTGDAKARRWLMWDNFLVHSATGFRRAAYERAGRYGLAERIYADYDLWVRMLALGEFAFFDEPTVEYFFSPHSLSRHPRQVGLRYRWRCQRTAIASFWRRHPVAAASCLALGATRQVLGRWV